MRRPAKSPYLASVLSFLVPGLGQLYAGEGLRGGMMLFASIVIGSLHAIWLSVHAIASAEATPFWASTLPRVLHDVFAVWSLVFWAWIIVDAYHIASSSGQGGMDGAAPRD
jgi:TM2 domain-containing membrane protein YozV